MLGPQSAREILCAKLIAAYCIGIPASTLPAQLLTFMPEVPVSDFRSSGATSQTFVPRVSGDLIVSKRIIKMFGQNLPASAPKYIGALLISPNTLWV